MRGTENISVCMITYNHEKFISKAIEGVLNQIADLELLIVDDASTDKTPSIIAQYVKEHPRGDQIRFVRNSENKGMINNFIFALQQCQSELIALCEGDDFWDDTNKLNVQKRLLDENQTLVGVFHDVKIITKRGIRDSFLRHVSKRDFENGVEVGIKAIIEQKWIIPTCSVMFRKSALIFPDIFFRMRHGDFPLFCFLALSGPFMYLSKPMGVYRMNNDQSVVNSIKPLETITVHTNYIEFLQWLNVFSNFQYESSIRERILAEVNGINDLVRAYQKGKFYVIYQKYILPLKKFGKLFS